MTSAYVNQFLLPPGNSDQDQSHLPTFSSLAQRPSSFACPLLFSSADVQGHVLCHGHPYEHNGLVLIDSGPNNITLYSANTNSNKNSEITRQPSKDELSREGADGSLKWMPSKMRWMKKMLAPDKVAAGGTRSNAQAAQNQQLLSQDSSSGSTATMSLPTGVIRICSDCNTTKTPLWRSGPQGPKSLCNACGIRQRKARRAMAAAAAAAAAAAGGGAIHSTQKQPGKMQMDKLSEGNCILPFKKRCKMANNGTAQKKLKFEDNKIISLSSDSAVHRVLPQDERDAAILLMALSCGIIYG